MKSCKITVISVVLNASGAFATTAASIVGQDYPWLEWIVIDGGSTDGTVDLIRKFEDKISYWISEPDQGIYDGMNKGLAHATGEWVNFMNAGDSFVTGHTITDIFSRDLSGQDVVYGDCIIRYQQVTKYQEAGTPEDLLKGMAFCHQAVFTRISRIREHGFDLQYRIGADFHMLIGLWQSGCHFLHIDIPVTVFDNGGVSNQNMFKSAKEHYTIVKRSGKASLPVRLHHLMFITWVGILSLVYRVFPDKLVQFARTKLIRLMKKTVNS